MAKSYVAIIYLSTPLAMPAGKAELFPIHFDGLLTRLKADSLGLTDYSALTAKDIDLPLERYGTDKIIYKASSLMIHEPAKVSREPWFKSQSWIDYGRGLSPKEFEKQIRPGQGPYRAAAGYLHLIETPYVCFYFCGNAVKVGDILKRLIGGGIGTRINAGYGQVKGIEIKPSEDYSLIAKDGYPARNIPVSEIKGDPRWQILRGIYKPPYWNYEDPVLCYVSPRWHWWPVKSAQKVMEEILKHGGGK